MVSHISKYGWQTSSSNGSTSHRCRFSFYFRFWLLMFLRWHSPILVIRDGDSSSKKKRIHTLYSYVVRNVKHRENYRNRAGIFSLTVFHEDKSPMPSLGLRAVRWNSLHHNDCDTMSIFFLKSTAMYLLIYLKHSASSHI